MTYQGITEPDSALPPNSSDSRVSATELVRSFGVWQGRALVSPVEVTRHGRTQAMLLSKQLYDHLSKSKDKQSEAGYDSKFSILIDRLQDNFLTLDEEWRFTNANARLCSFLKKSRDEIVGRGYYEIFPRHQDSIIGQNMRRISRGGDMAVIEAPSIIYPEKTLLFTIFSFPGGIASLVRDITEQVTHRDIQAVRQSFIDAFEAHALFGTAILDSRGRMSEIRNSTARLLGIRREEHLDRQFLDLFPAESRSRARRHLESVLAGKGATVFEDLMLIGGTDRKKMRVAIAEIKGDFVVSGATVALSAAREGTD